MVSARAVVAIVGVLGTGAGGSLVADRTALSFTREEPRL
jgi:hypothetical protein